MASTTRVCIGSCRGSTSSINPSARWGDIVKPLLPSPAWARSASRGDLSRKRERGPFCPVGRHRKAALALTRQGSLREQRRPLPQAGEGTFLPGGGHHEAALALTRKRERGPFGWERVTSGAFCGGGVRR